MDEADITKIFNEAEKEPFIKQVPRLRENNLNKLLQGLNNFINKNPEAKTAKGILDRWKNIFEKRYGS